MLVLTREIVRPYLDTVTVAPITSTVRGLATEVGLGPQNGLDGPSAANCDHIATIPQSPLGRRIGVLFDHQEAELSAAVRAAFDLD